MAKKSVLGHPTHISHLPKQGFNLSEPFKFTSSCGQLLPVLFDFLNPSERIRVSFDLFTRTMPVSTAAIVDVDEYVELFFVPLKKIYSPAPQILENIDDFTSSVFGDGGSYSIKDAAYENKNCVIPSFNPYECFSQDKNTEPYFVPDETLSDYGQEFDYWYAGAYRLADHLGYNPNMFLDKTIVESWHSEDFEDAFDVQLNPALFLCYQAIYFDYYRLSNWEANKVYAYNVDTLSRQADQYMAGYGVYTTADKLKEVFQLRYRPYERDYFKAIEPSPLMGSVGLLEDGYNVFRMENNYTGNEIQPVNRNGLTTVPTATGVAVVPNQYDETISAYNIRALFAVDKLAKITGRAGKHYDDQVLAHFGFEIPKGISDEVYFLGRHHQELHIGEVIATASTSEAPLGEIAGKGYSQGNSNDFEFVAPCHGYLMAIYSCVPKPSYVTGINKINTLIDRWDYYQPEFDKLGMQPLFGYEFYASFDNLNQLCGWQPRYMQFKTKYPRATRAFDNRPYGSSLQVGEGGFRDWTLTNRGNRTGRYDGLDSLLCSPEDLNQIMLTSYKTMIERSDLSSQEMRFGVGIYDDDPLIHSLRTKYYKTSPMSTFGVEPL